MGGPLIPREIASVRKGIAGKAATQSVSYVWATWDSWLRKACWSDEDIDRVRSRLNGEPITRIHIVGCAHSVTEGTARPSELLALALIWGRGKKNGRMKSHIVRLLSRENLDTELSEIWRAARSGDLAAAHRSWRLSGLREPFFTKFLWACTADLQENERCLVLDGNVRRTLSKLDVVLPRGEPGGRYKLYVETVRSWSGDQASPEDLEWALFSANGNLTKLRSLGASAGG